MRKNFLLPYRIVYIFTALFAVLFTALRFYMLKTGFDAANGFYTSENLHTAFRYSLIAITAIAFAIAHIYIKKEEKFRAPMPENGFSRAVSFVCGAVLCGFPLYLLARIVFINGAPFSVANLIMSVLALVSMSYYFSKYREHSQIRALFGIASSLFLLAMVFGIYFNKTVSYINHTVVLAFAAAIFTMLATTAEANFSLERSAYRRYCSYAPVAVILCCALAIPDIIYYLQARTVLLVDFYYDIILLAFGLYHFARLTAIMCDISAFAED